MKKIMRFQNNNRIKLIHGKLLLYKKLEVDGIHDDHREMLSQVFLKESLCV